MDTKMLCLGVLEHQDASGYDVRKFFERAYSHFYRVGLGSLYPSLRSLAKEGLVTYREVSDGRGRQKRIYSITEAGRERLRQALLDIAPSEHLRSEFLVAMFFAHLLPSEHVGRIMDQQASRLEAELLYLRAFEGHQGISPGMRFTIRYGIAAKQARLEVIRRYRHDLSGDTASQPGPSTDGA